MAINIPLITSFDSKGITKAIQQFKKLEGGTQKSAFVVKNLENNMGKAFKSLAMVAGGAALAGGAIAKVLLSQAYEAKKVTAETNAIIAATGGAARISAEGVAALSDKLSMQIGVDDELIQKSANLLLTFKQVQNQTGAGNDIFSQAVTLAQDLGSVFGSTDSAAMQLGKALSDPVAGLTALKRAGINFSESQKETIKNLVAQGDLLGAQKVILNEVSTQVGGTAAASATGFDRMKVAVENVAEQLGTLLLPYFEDLANWITTVVVPVISEFATIVGEQGLGAAIGNLSGKFLDWIGNLKGTGEVIYWVLAAIAALTAGIYAFAIAEAVATVAVTAFDVAWNASGIGLIATAVAAIVVAIIAMALKWQWLRDVLKDVWNAIVTGLQAYINIMLEAWETLINGIIWGINKMITAWNAVSWGTDIEHLDEVNLQLDITGAKIDSVTKKVIIMANAINKHVQGTGIGGSRRSPEMGGSPVIPNPFNDNNNSGAGKTIKTAAELLKAFTDKLKSYGSELKAVAQATKQIETANKNLVKAIKDVTAANDDLTAAQSAVADALANFNQVARGFGVGSAQAAEAQRNLSQAQRDGVRAGIDLADAQQAVAAAQQKIIDLQKAADPRTIQEAQDNITKATYDLADAQKELDRAQRRGNVREIEMASIALRDAQNNLTDAQTELNDANEAADPQALIDAQEELTNAELDAEEARLALIDATDAVTAAQTLLNEAINGAAVGTEAYNAALELLNTARAEEAAAAQAVIDAIDAEAEARARVTEAIEAEAEAKRDLAEATNELNVARGLVTPAQIAAAQAATGINAPALDFSGVDFAALGRYMKATGFKGRANGGSVMAGTPYIVGERGQELFVPNNNGTIIPNHDLSQGGMNIIVNVAGSVTTERQLVEQIRVGLLKAQKSGRAMVL